MRRGLWLRLIVEKNLEVKKENMKNFYFTFGSWERYPYQDTYLVVVASDSNNAFDAFRKKYPDIHNGCLNCSFWYDEKQWKNDVNAYYKAMPPAEVILADGCFRDKPDGYGDVVVYVPYAKQIVLVSEGTGMLPEDMKKSGYVDYIYYAQYEFRSGSIEAVNVGHVLLEDSFRDRYACTADCIRDVMDMAYGNPLIGCMILD